MPMSRTRRIVFGVTAVIWLGLCALVLWGLVIQAADAIDEYARTPSFQLINFAVGYLPTLVLLLLVVLGAEYLTFCIAERWRRRLSKGAGSDQVRAPPAVIVR